MLNLLLKSKILLSIWIVSGVILSSLFFFIPYITKKNIDSLVIQNSKNNVEQIKLIRSYYLNNIVNKVKANSTKFNFVSNHTSNNSLPLPATLIHDLSHLFNKNMGTKFRTYSNYPFKNRISRVLSFEDKQTLEIIKKTNDIYISKDVVNNKPVLKVAIPDYMIDISCVNCHNNHSDKTWENDKWHIGDIRGVIEIITPLEKPLLQIQSMRTTILVFIAVIFVILIIYYSYMLLKNQQELLNINDILDIKVKQEIQKNNEKEQILIQKSKLSSQGEMINTIAHQWRQPLSELSALFMNIDMQYTMGTFNQQILNEKISKSEILLNYLSNTIDDFSNFLKEDKEKSLFYINEVISNVLNISNIESFKDIEIKKVLQDNLQMYGFKSELSQVLLNIISNSKEQFIKKSIHNPIIKIKIYKHKENLIIIIEDNALGIQTHELTKVFDLYYTTKKDGSGIGLYISKIIIEKHFNGKISVKNHKDGISFKLDLPC